MTIRYFNFFVLILIVVGLFTEADGKPLEQDIYVNAGTLNEVEANSPSMQINLYADSFISGEQDKIYYTSSKTGKAARLPFPEGYEKEMVDVGILHRMYHNNNDSTDSRQIVFTEKQIQVISQNSSYKVSELKAINNFFGEYNPKGELLAFGNIVNPELRAKVLNIYMKRCDVCSRENATTLLTDLIEKVPEAVSGDELNWRGIDLSNMDSAKIDKLFQSIYFDTTKSYKIASDFCDMIEDQSKYYKPIQLKNFQPKIYTNTIANLKNIEVLSEHGLDTNYICESGNSLAEDASSLKDKVLQSGVLNDEQKKKIEAIKINSGKSIEQSRKTDFENIDTNGCRSLSEFFDFFDLCKLSNVLEFFDTHAKKDKEKNDGPVAQGDVKQFNRGIASTSKRKCSVSIMYQVNKGIITEGSVKVSKEGIVKDYEYSLKGQSFDDYLSNIQQAEKKAKEKVKEKK